MTIKKILKVNSILNIVLIIILILLWFISYTIKNNENKKINFYMFCNRYMTELVLLTDEYSDYHYTRTRDQWFIVYKKLKDNMDNYNLTTNNYKNNFKELNNLFSRIILLYDDNGQFKQNTSLSINSLNLLVEKVSFDMKKLSRDLIYENFTNLSQSTKYSHIIFKRNNILIIIYLILILVITIFIVRKLLSTIIPPMNELVRGASLIESGNFNYTFGQLDNKTKIDPNNEIGSVAAALNRMSMTLMNLVKNLKSEVAIRTKIETELRIERDNLRNIFDSMSDGVTIVDSDYNVVFVNNTLQKSLGARDNKKCYFYFHAFNEPCSWCKKNTKNFTQSIRWEYLSSDTSKTYDIIDTPLKNSDGSISMLEISRDISDRKKSEQEVILDRDKLEKIVNERTKKLKDQNKFLLQSRQAIQYLLEDVNNTQVRLATTNKKLFKTNKDLEAFSHSVSHDLRSPLRAVLGFSNKLQKHIGNTADPESLRLLNTISENTVKMQNLITDLLAYSKVGSSNLSKSEIDMNQLGSVLYSEYKNIVKEKDISLEILHLPKAYGNFSMIKQVLINLLENAIKFSDKGKKSLITIGYSAENEGAYYIKDNGCGFDNKFSNEIFKIFKRVNENTKIEGTGVGLAIVKRMIDSHGGQVWAESESKKGSVFYFTLSTKSRNLN